MLQIVIPETELWDEINNQFIHFKGITLELEHSLISVSKWESKWEKPYFTENNKTDEEIMDYISCMCLNKNVDPIAFRCLTRKNIDDIIKYIQAPHTATTFSDTGKQPPNREIFTSEVIYYAMIANQIPFECQKWHINRLLTLIRVCSIKNQPPKKMSRVDAMKQQAELNAKRRAKFNSSG